MCGRFLLTVDLAEIIKRFGLGYTNISYTPKPEIFPSDSVPILVNPGEKQLRIMKWGFKASFTDKLLINARSETVDVKPTFQPSFLRKRCIIPANGFFEWKDIDNKKVKHQITLPEQKIFSFAGLYNIFKDKNNKAFEAFTILTTSPNEDMKQLHHRMPVILDPSVEDLWLNHEIQDQVLLKALLKPFEGKLVIQSLL